MIDSPEVTLALAIGAGSLILVASERIRIPALLPLLAGGILLGRSGAGLVDTHSIGALLEPVITLGIGLLVYEGGLHLTWRELRKAPRAVGGLITVGSFLTWMLGSAAAVAALGLGWPAALLLGAMLTVTGPTVVQPILRRIRVSPRLRTALNAEAVLIDPIGVLLTVVVLTILKGAAITPVSAAMFFEGARAMGFQVLSGAGIGLAVGLVSLGSGRLLTRRGRIQPQQLNLLAVGSCMAAVGVGSLVTPEAGLVASVVAAICLGSLRSVGVADLHHFGQQLAAITVATLFVLLGARFDVGSLRDAGIQDALFVAALIALVRPISAQAALFGSHLDARERIFASLFAPRGIVALSVAVIASQDLARFAESRGTITVDGALVDLDAFVRDARSLERVMFLVIVGTVCWASFPAWILARWLGVGGSRPRSVLLIGGHALAQQTASVLKSLGVEVTVVDSHSERVLRAESAGAVAIRGDATDLRWMEETVGCDDIGLVLAWTGNPDVDLTVARWAGERFGRGEAALWAVGKIPPEAEWIELGGGRLLDEVRDEIEAGRWRVDRWSADDAEASRGAVPFMAVRDGRPRYVRSGAGAIEDPGGDERTVLVGLVRAGEPGR